MLITLGEFLETRRNQIKEIYNNVDEDMPIGKSYWCGAVFAMDSLIDELKEMKVVNNTGVEK